MIYIFDTSSLSHLQHFYRGVFTSLWDGLDNMVADQRLISTREVSRELENASLSIEVVEWTKSNKQIFTTPSAEELLFVAEIFKVKHFQALIGEKQRLKGTPVADPFVIACARRYGGTVVTEERLKPNAAKIPNVCAHFKIGCISLEGFMQQQAWKF